jgi:dimethylaniline monooxygenase (N-oxide forming)
MPYISAPYRHLSSISRVRASYINVPIIPTSRTITLAPWPTSITSSPKLSSNLQSSGFITFQPSTRPEAFHVTAHPPGKPDMVIYCTGYKQSFPFLDHTYPVPLSCDHRSIWKTGDETVGFIGFVRPSMGAIPSLAEMQAMAFTTNLVENILNPRIATSQGQNPRRARRQRIDHPLDYKLHVPQNRREYESYGVDHESYAYQLALDIGVAPSFTQLLRYSFRPKPGSSVASRLRFGSKVVFTWAMGPNFNTKFRMLGPWAWDGADNVMGRELWDVVSRSGGGFCELNFILFLSRFCKVLRTCCEANFSEGLFRKGLLTSLL